MRFTYCIFNYDVNTWSDDNELILLGFTDGITPLNGGISMFSNTDDTNLESGSDPYAVFHMDNTGTKIKYILKNV